MKRIILTLAAAAAISAGASAQEAFKHLSIGVDAGTTGIGVELALPVVSDHLVLAAGYNYVPAISLSRDMTFTDITNDLNSTINDVNSDLAKTGTADRINTTFSPVTASLGGSVNMGTVKAILEYYPSKKSSFHISAGIYYGATDILTADCVIDDQFFTEYSQLNGEVESLKAKYPGVIDESLPSTFKGNVSGRTYQFNTTTNKSIDATLAVKNSVRPYVGLGWGRSIPDSHFGFQFDLGAWFHGAPDIESSNEVAYDASAEEILTLDPYSFDDIQKLSFYPQLSFRLIYRIF